MTDFLQVGHQTIPVSEIIPRLTRYKMLPQLLREMIIDEAIASVSCTPEEKATAKERFYEQNQLTDETARRAWCERNCITPEELEDLAVRLLKIEKFQQATWGHQVESLFLERKEQLDRVSYSLIRTRDAGLAQELYYRLEEGEQTFAELAREYSQGVEAQKGGLIGPMPLTMTHPAIAQILSTSQPGQLCPPVRIEEWIVIVRLEKLFSAQLDRRLRRRLLDELFQNWLFEQLDRLTQTPHLPIA
ncbi:peptidylprolyl isomerase [Pleurocapsales cyanobacterium LEGE 06147]|nr:peptidylprolyl isomerase [Pleurocapsales cyanobacterium LEGE 06147]